MTPIERLFNTLSTPTKLVIALGLALLPIGALTVYTTSAELADTRRALRGEAQGEMLTAARAVEALVARNTLALRVSAYGALSVGERDPCLVARDALSVAPAVARRFSITAAEGAIECGDLDREGLVTRGPVANGRVELWVDPEREGLLLGVGIPGASATGMITAAEMAEAIAAATTRVDGFVLDDGEEQLVLIGPPGPTAEGRRHEELTIGLVDRRLTAHAAADYVDVDLRDRLNIFLPVLMWALAAILSWALVHLLFMRPLRRLNHAVRDYDVATHDFAPPAKLGPAREIRELGESFAGTVSRIEEGERDLIAAIEGQRRLVREVHHRVKNNLQVVASLLNIHSRGAHGDEAREAYAGIGRRVEALSVVHRNHFAEIEESRGIQLRPLITELAASLRASAPDARLAISLDLDGAATTQDAAVSAAFFITEVVEYAILRDAIELEIALRRTSELTARLTVASEALVGAGGSDQRHRQFERIVDGLSRQLRSPLDRKLGGYSVELPVFPEENAQRPAR
ncbi:sensor histidine kinase [Sphingomicrobium astaxanthinifaciens]|uniref:sensor histidine kinase n=1 Tax=Sphingomicrobium astaxanthinifaciens TaxID=1227949 RepID=UPI001FCB89DB|nr:sensor histidine kinase [Sphingomicrobium astaxanthinifaciens]MCJ7421659.1 sensor histidine kinase [Sphingomicrobium astaxanthinifaciens]